MIWSRKRGAEGLGDRKLLCSPFHVFHFWVIQLKWNHRSHLFLVPAGWSVDSLVPLVFLILHSQCDVDAMTVCACVVMRLIRTSRCLHGLQCICPRPPHMSAVRTCVTADIDELIHSQLQPLMMSPPTAAKRRLTFLIVLLFSTGSRGLSLDDVLAFVWLPLVQLGVKLMKGTLLENIRGLRWFHQAQISSPTR